MSAMIARASVPNARNMVFSRPMWSESQPKKVRDAPFIRLFSERANGSAPSVIPSSETWTFARLKFSAMGPNWATTISPPVATMVNMR